jgi:pyruvate/2-oxoglutarate dehydrogenase complex dihydrolipoamide acyltransferase (E2) component
MLRRRNKAMMNNKVVFISIMIVLLVSLILPACSPTKPAATPAAPAATTPPAPTATPPPAPAAPAAKALSFDAATYTNDELGFTWKYPSKWTGKEIYQNFIVMKIASDQQGADTAGIIVIPQAADFAAAVKGEFDNEPQLKAGNTKVAVSEVKTITLADGKTSGTSAIVTGDVMGGLYKLYAPVTGFNKGGKTIIAFSYTLGNEAKQALGREIASTLTPK